jgi:hypothetical protein
MKYFNVNSFWNLYKKDKLFINIFYTVFLLLFSFREKQENTNDEDSEVDEVSI